MIVSLQKKFHYSILCLAFQHMTLYQSDSSRIHKTDISNILIQNEGGVDLHLVEELDSEWSALDAENDKQPIGPTKLIILVPWFF